MEQLLERLREIMGREFGIETNEQLQEAVRHQEGPDLGIFVTSLETGVKNAS